PAYFRFRLLFSQPHGGVAIRFTQFGTTCGVRAELGYMSGSTFIPFPGERFHVLHLDARISNQVVGPVNIVGPVYNWQVGTLLTSSTCKISGNASHAHLSCDIDPTTPVYRNISPNGLGADTCWTNQES